MLFNSFEFIFWLLPISLGGYFLAARASTRLAIWWLVCVSFFFYGWWNPSDLPLLIGSVLFNFAVGRYLQAERPAAHRKAALVTGIVLDLAVLGFCKYGAFFAANLGALLHFTIPLPSVRLPLGISFFTFTQITFLVDNYRERKEITPFRNFALFVSFYPHLLAGPILHHGDMLPQFADPENKRSRASALWRGLALFCVGLSKKVLLADALAPFARAGFDQMAAPSTLDAWLAVLAYTFQIYFDFSGYTDMAVGIAQMFNIRLPFNFNSPYRSTDIQAFWRRWHITLGTFFRDYLYIPLGGNKLGRGRTLANLFLVALWSGLWHGAAWSFVLWGGLHGIAMVIHNLWKRTGRVLPRALAWAIMFLFIVVSWVPFRATEWPRARVVLSGLCGANGTRIPLSKPTLERKWSRRLKEMEVRFAALETKDAGVLAAYLALAALIAFWPRNSNLLLTSEHSAAWWQLVILATLAAASILQLNKLSEFIYFNF
jgi:D-alanyl-lipoteichoic acid acyltransferase DltB (MBOAT superfamily)